MGSSSGGSSSSGSSSSSKIYTEGGITYENKGGNIYKNGQLVPESNYKYIPTAIGGTRDGTPSSSGGGSSSIGGTLIGGIVTGIGNYLSNMANQPPVEPLPPPLPQQIPEMYDPTEYINDLKEAQRASRIAALDKAKEGALSALDTEKANVAPTYYDKRNQAAAASDVGAMNFAQYMAARGIKGAAGAMPEIYRQAGLQGQIGALDRQEAAELSAIERQRANIETGYASDVAAAEADVEAQAMQNFINQWNANRAYQLQQAAMDLERQKFDWSKSPSNPAYQASIAAAKAAELDNVAREIQNSYLPDTLKFQAERLAQQVKTGSLDYDIALAQLNQIKAQTAVYNRQANAPYSTGGSGSDGYSATTGTQSGGYTPTTAVKNAKPVLSELKNRGYGMQSAIEFARANILPSISGADIVAKNKAWDDIMDYIHQLYNYGSTTGMYVGSGGLTSPGES